MKRKFREETHLLLNRGEKLVVDNVEKAKLLHTFFASIFIGEVWSQKWESNRLAKYSDPWDQIEFTWRAEKAFWCDCEGNA